MAHELYIVNDKASMAFAASGGKAWHGLGNPMPENATIDEWKSSCGFDWEIKKSPVIFMDSESNKVMKFDNKFVLYRSDTMEPISIMSERYQEVQPTQVLDFFRDLCESQRWTMETAGVLKGGAQYWALAKAGLNAYFDNNVDKHEMYMLLSTSADGSLATSARATDIRVVCSNTLQMSLRGRSKRSINVRHNTIFDAQKIKEELNLVDMSESWNEFMNEMRRLGEIKLTSDQATSLFTQILKPNARKEYEAESFDTLLTGNVKTKYNKVVVDKEPRKIRYLDDLESAYRNAPGATPGTAYGILNAVTYFSDHLRGKPSSRLANSWFGTGVTLKDNTMNLLSNINP